MAASSYPPRQSRPKRCPGGSRAANGPALLNQLRDLDKMKVKIEDGSKIKVKKKEKEAVGAGM
ncbi:hypothetical protein GCM10022408_31240 [Hymenobacter fastidiosus]|uniref:Small basic protein n=1 Tax=Hymenobacter fastidiosus TaxID=486264 RepID=A0ABP7SSE2_9BACT